MWGLFAAALIVLATAPAEADGAASAALLAEADAARGRGDWARAAELYEAFLRQAPDAPEADAAEKRLAEAREALRARAGPTAAPAAPTTVIVNPPPLHVTVAAPPVPPPPFPWGWATLAGAGLLFGGAAVVFGVASADEARLLAGVDSRAEADRLLSSSTAGKNVALVLSLAAAAAAAGGIVLLAVRL